MDMFLDYKGSNKKTKKKLKFNKPYWTSDLTKMWKDMRAKEKLYLKSHADKKENTTAHQSFKHARNLFDKSLRSCERKYFRDKALEIDQCNTSYAIEFWQYIKN